MSDPQILGKAGLAVSPLSHLGGAIGVFSVGGRDILRPRPRDATDLLETAFREEGADYIAAMIVQALCETVGRLRPLLVVAPRPDRRKRGSRTTFAESSGKDYRLVSIIPTCAVSDSRGIPKAVKI